MNKNSTKLARQVAGTMAIEGMKLNKSEYEILVRCASGKQSAAKTIQEMISKYTVK